jgi:hypothetical protein
VVAAAVQWVAVEEEAEGDNSLHFDLKKFTMKKKPG